MKSLLEQLQSHALNYPDHLAVVFENSSITYRELWGKTVAVSDFLKEKGVKKGDRVIVQTSYCKYFAAVCYACWLCHAVFVPVDSNANEQTLLTVCKQLDSHCVISNIKINNTVISITYSELDHVSEISGNNIEFPSENDFANIMFTTGTTGNPKGVIWSHKNILKNCLVRHDMFDFDSQSVDMSFVPLNHAAPLWKLYAINYYSGTCILLDGMSNLNCIYNFIKKYNVNSMYASPSGIAVIQSLAPEIFTDNANRIKMLSVSSSAMNENTVSFIKENMPLCRLFFSYGASESGADTYYCLNNEKKDISCVGKACNGVEIKIVDDNMKTLPANKTGIVIIKSNMTFCGYWNNPELTEKCFYNGYYVSSDTGYFDEDGYLYITGRKDDIINIGGLKVYPSEIENAVMKSGLVQDCICFAINDRITKQAACLQIVSDKQNALLLNDIRQYLKENLDSYKVPKFIEFTSQIEKTSNGKPNRKKQAEKRM